METANKNKKQTKRQLQGVVVSSKMKDTIVVRVSRYVKHPRYGKFIEIRKKFKAHDAGNTKVVDNEVQEDSNV